MAEERAIAEIQVRDVMTVAVEELSPAEGLARASIRGIQAMIGVLEAPANHADLKWTRLQIDTGAMAARLFFRASEGEFRKRHDEALERLLEELSRDKEKGG